MYEIQDSGELPESPKKPKGSVVPEGFVELFILNYGGPLEASLNPKRVKKALKAVLKANRELELEALRQEAYEDDFYEDLFFEPLGGW